jgi:hypothetical protein
MSLASVQLVWKPQEPPLAVAAALTHGPATIALARALFYDDERRSQCVVVGSGEWLVAIGDNLPWVDGATWLGRVGGLLMPTAVQPTLSVALVSDALFRNRRRTSIAVLTPHIALLAPMPIGPPTVDLLASTAGIPSLGDSATVGENP